MLPLITSERSDIALATDSEGYRARFRFKMDVFFSYSLGFLYAKPIDLPSFLREVLRSMLKTLQMELKSCKFVHIHRHLRTLNCNHGRIWNDLFLSNHKCAVTWRIYSLDISVAQPSPAGYQRHTFVADCGMRDII